MVRERQINLLYFVSSLLLLIVPGTVLFFLNRLSAELIFSGLFWFFFSGGSFFLLSRLMKKSVKLLMHGITVLMLAKIFLLAVILVGAHLDGKANLKELAVGLVIFYLFFTVLETGFLYRKSKIKIQAES